MGEMTAAPAIARAADGSRPRAARGAAIVSTRVFHEPQAGPWPAHFGELAPHCWHR
jgi:hypothetical protein